jgi:hypothetical protein
MESTRRKNYLGKAGASTLPVERRSTARTKDSNGDINIEQEASISSSGETVLEIFVPPSAYRRLLAKVAMLEMENKQLKKENICYRHKLIKAKCEGDDRKRENKILMDNVRRSYFQLTRDIEELSDIVLADE